MKFQAFLNVLLIVCVLILALAVYLQTETADELRKDVNRVSRAQVACQGREDYGRCMSEQAHLWRTFVREIES